MSEKKTEKKTDKNDGEPSQRKDDPAGNRLIYRSRRLFFAGNGWYLATREGERGPFPSKRIALLELRHFLRELNRAEARKS